MPESNSDWQEAGTNKVSIPSLSALLDLRVPVVELEAERLHAAMSWLYTAVQKLQQQQVTTSGDVLQLQEQLHSFSPVTTAEPSKIPEDVQLMLRQQEQRRVGDVAQLEMRLHGLRASIDGCLKSSDLEALRERLYGELDVANRSCKEELASLSKWLQMDSASERQQLQENFQILRSKVEAQLDLALESGKNRPVSKVPSESVVETQRGYQEEPPVVPVVPETSPEGRHSNTDTALLSKVEQMEASMRDMWQSLRNLSMAAPSAPTAPTTPAQGSKEIDPRVLQRFTDVDKAHLSNIQRFSEIEQRLTRLETSVPAMPMAKAGGDWQGPVSELKSSYGTLSQDLQASATEVSTLRSALTELTRYISEDHLEVSATAPPNKLEWLERRISQLVAKRKGPSLEKRLQLLEEVTGSKEIFQRVHNLEQLLGRLDLDAVKEVPPQLTIVKEDQETFKQDLRCEVQELKVLVGCMEACVPKETRKAIQLFQRGTGVSDEEFINPSELKAHTQLLSLCEEMDGRLAEIQMNAAQQYDNMNLQLQELEMKQERVEHLMKVKPIEGAPKPTTPETFVAPEGWQR